MLTRYLWDYATNTCLAEMDEQGETLVDYTVDPQTGELISENHGGQEVYHRYDGDGNTRQTADSAGNVLGEATYSAFGETVAESGDMQTTYRFRGQQGFSTDPLTGDISKANLIYAPTAARVLGRPSLASLTVARKPISSRWEALLRTSWDLAPSSAILDALSEIVDATMELLGILPELVLRELRIESPRAAGKGKCGVEGRGQSYEYKVVGLGGRGERRAMDS